jgi:hypothetical protein
VSRLHAQVIFCALCSWTLLCFVTARSPVSLHFYDPVIQLRALQQHQRGETPAWNILRRVDPADLSRDRLETVAWWPPAIPALAGPLMSAGLSLGAALRWVVIVTGAVGAVGWAVWWTRFPLPRLWLFTLAVFVPWLRPSSAGFFRFSGDNLAVCAAPWLFLGMLAIANRLISGRIQSGTLAFSGLVLGLSALVKYSLAVVTVSAFLALAGLVWSRSTTRRRTLVQLAVLGLGLLVVPLAIKTVGVLQGAGDPGAHLAPDNRTWPTPFYALANPVLGLTDAGSPIRLVLTKLEALPINLTANPLAWIGLPGAILLIFLYRHCLTNVRSRSTAEVFALLAPPVFSILMLVIWFLSDAARDVRLFIPVTFAALPAVILPGMDLLNRSTGVFRFSLLAGAVGYVVLPLFYGPFFVGAKIAGARNVNPAALGVHLPTLGVDDEAALLNEMATWSSPDAVWIVPDYEISLALPGRFITPLSGRSIAQDLDHVYVAPASLSNWQTSAPVTLLALADPGDDPPALVASIPGKHHWAAHPLSGGRKILWTARLEPAASP